MLQGIHLLSECPRIKATSHSGAGEHGAVGAQIRYTLLPLSSRLCRLAAWTCRRAGRFIPCGMKHYFNFKFEKQEIGMFIHLNRKVVGPPSAAHLPTKTVTSTSSMVCVRACVHARISSSSTRLHNIVACFMIKAPGSLILTYHFWRLKGTNILIFSVVCQQCLLKNSLQFVHNFKVIMGTVRQKSRLSRNLLPLQRSISKKKEKCSIRNISVPFERG